MNDKISVHLCKNKEENKNLAYKELIAWVTETYKLQCSIPDSKHHNTATYPLMEEALNNWFLTRQEMVNMSGDLNLKGGYSLKKLSRMSYGCKCDRLYLNNSK
ncbi:hypothetical protein GcM1_021001 [Golovinomyces cichoracearum]|uniref:Uncharacterized protein n=1 Tax=Golovinomyces cichoracearum TaxID=62708 RepID=A0A420JCI0_9PEZI|nr:hypothetical protein GcM1_021001 [Golovinomyces cichoracearum]